MKSKFGKNEKKNEFSFFPHTHKKKNEMGGQHVRFKDDEMMDVEKNKEEEEEGERGVSPDFGPDPEFTIRKPVANLKMMMMAAEEEVKDKEERRRSTVKLRNKWTEEKGSSSDACYITQIESNFDFSKVCYRTSANEAKVFDTTTNTTNTNNLSLIHI